MPKNKQVSTTVFIYGSVCLVDLSVLGMKQLLTCESNVSAAQLQTLQNCIFSKRTSLNEIDKQFLKALVNNSITSNQIQRVKLQKVGTISRPCCCSNYQFGTRYMRLALTNKSQDGIAVIIGTKAVPFIQFWKSYYEIEAKKTVALQSAFSLLQC